MKILTFAALFLLQTTNLFPFQFETYSVSDFKTSVTKDIQKSITRFDKATLSLKNIYLLDEEFKNHVLEVTIILRKESNSSFEVYSTVFPVSMKEKSSNIYSLDGVNITYNNLLERIDLRNVRHIELSILPRPIKGEQVQLFNQLSGLLGQARLGNEIVNTIRSIVSSPENAKVDEIMQMNAKFFIPANFISYNNFEKTKEFPLLKASNEYSIAFQVEGKQLPRGILQRFTNFIIGEKVFTDSKNVTGVANILVTKNDIDPIPEVYQNDLRVIVQNYVNGKFNDANTNKSELKNKIDAFFTPGSRNQDYLSIQTLLRLFDVYEIYLNEGDIRKEFKEWLDGISIYGGALNFHTYYINDIYNNDMSNEPSNVQRAAPLHIPQGLDPFLIGIISNMQIKFHEGIVTQSRTDSFEYYKDNLDIYSIVYQN
tara:strand:+ start:107008 stop:108288 length:1281 start_codon:yes stop_codon:yes gene_type:complete